ncbi:MAG: GAF domain-containing sensor histidine kinase [Desulfuromonadaceae bacterium]|nr:GAF domain-containing sensor histidine kinase [Desulfuromonadaceae bacterium]MDD2855229.1 GAF domain-containing sensor histidine kinase [Desulfuromonadaceae bacterium]
MDHSITESLMPGQEITPAEIDRLYAEQKRNKERLQSLVNVFQYDAVNSQALLDFALNEAIVITSSRYGYIYYYEEKSRQFILNSWSNGVMDACSIVNPQTLYQLDKTGVWGEAVRQRKPIIINDFSAPHPDKRGYPEGHVKLTSFMTVPLFDKGVIVAVVGVANKASAYDDSDVMQLTLLMDAVWKVSERKRYEEDLKQKNAELERFVYTVSHDLKSPLVTVSSFLAYLEQDIKSGDHARISADIGYMHAATEKMNLMLGELLELARIGRLNYQPELFLLSELVQESLQLVAGSISERGVTVKVVENSVELMAKRQRILEIWLNLIENAIKYMGDQPEPFIELGLEQVAGEFIFYVRDNGLGIDPNFKDNIFGIFNKLDPSSKGSGIGLAVVKRIVELYGGRLWVESEGLGHGSCFRFTLPLALKK